jgi:hypothetical protein
MPEIEGATTTIDDDVKLMEEDATEIAEPVEEPEPAPEPEEEPPIPDTAHPFARPSIKQIHEKYPDVFKAFPSLRDMYFREAEFSKLFPTVEDAKEAARDVEAYRGLRYKMESGSGEELFKFLEQEKYLDSFAPQIFPSLVRANPNSFWAAANPLVEDICRNMFNKGIKEGDENVQNAARHLAEYFFGDLLVAEGKRTFVKQPDPRIAAEASAEAKYDNERYLTFRGGVANSIQGEMSKLIQEGGRLEGLSSFLQSVISDKIIESVGSTLQQDSNHIRYMDSLWDRAKKNGRTDDDKNRLTAAYIARAKALIPQLRSKFLAEVNGKGPSASADKLKKVASASARADETTAGRPAGTRTTNYDPKRIDYSKTSDEDILNDEVKYRN